ncbi:hypothetical protein PM10SUCC1_17820 [Propionigenium maris DSM 9537]|uniref:Uncharacterized protein n=1 Tax=Propionigenium maris DSM 9537 TaxID=1123000 RepID=A0A9W6LN64_9FUSO|nr:hypothetical protein [Propionigenium maris]GLI56268.1 hypothetical protein PM10SUCC1_17820 [Propionigenium maris DSM 9537]
MSIMKFIIKAFVLFMLVVLLLLYNINSRAYRKFRRQEEKLRIIDFDSREDYLREKLRLLREARDKGVQLEEDHILEIEENGLIWDIRKEELKRELKGDI